MHESCDNLIIRTEGPLLSVKSDNHIPLKRARDSRKPPIDSDEQGDKHAVCMLTKANK